MEYASRKIQKSSNVYVQRRNFHSLESGRSSGLGSRIHVANSVNHRRQIPGKHYVLQAANQHLSPELSFLNLSQSSLGLVERQQQIGNQYYSDAAAAEFQGQEISNHYSTLSSNVLHGMQSCVSTQQNVVLGQNQISSVFFSTPVQQSQLQSSEHMLMPRSQFTEPQYTQQRVLPSGVAGVEPPNQIHEKRKMSLSEATAKVHLKAARLRMIHLPKLEELSRSLDPVVCELVRTGEPAELLDKVATLRQMVEYAQNMLNVPNKITVGYVKALASLHKFFETVYAQYRDIMNSLGQVQFPYNVQQLLQSQSQSPQMQQCKSKKADAGVGNGSKNDTTSKDNGQLKQKESSRVSEAKGKEENVEKTKEKVVNGSKKADVGVGNGPKSDTTSKDNGELRKKESARVSEAKDNEENVEKTKEKVIKTELQSEESNGAYEAKRNQENVEKPKEKVVKAESVDVPSCFRTEETKKFKAPIDVIEIESDDDDESVPCRTQNEKESERVGETASDNKMLKRKRESGQYLGESSGENNNSFGKDNMKLPKLENVVSAPLASKQGSEDRNHTIPSNFALGDFDFDSEDDDDEDDDDDDDDDDDEDHIGKVGAFFSSQGMLNRKLDVSGSQV